MVVVRHYGKKNIAFQKQMPNFRSTERRKDLFKIGYKILVKIYHKKISNAARIRSPQSWMSTT